MTNVLLAGATGMLGSRLAEHLLDAPGTRLRLLVRDHTADPARRALLDGLVARGAEVVVGDLADPDSLLAATRGVEVVVSALQGGRDVIVDGQVALARASAANGVRRFLPSDYALDLFKAPPGQLGGFDLRREADEQIAALGMEHVHVLTGAFLDGFLSSNGAVDYDDDAGTVTFWGTGDERFDATSVDDTARVAARAALDPAVPSGKFAVAAERLSFNDMVKAVESQRGRSYERRSRGPVDGLRGQIAEHRRAGDLMAATMDTYQVFMLSGEAALDDLQNDRYPDLALQSFAQVLAAGAADPAGARP